MCEREIPGRGRVGGVICWGKPPTSGEIGNRVLNTFGFGFNQAGRESGVRRIPLPIVAIDRIGAHALLSSLMPA